MTQQAKLAVALGILATLAVLAWRTMEPGKMQSFCWLALGFFAFRVVMSAVRSRYDEKHPEPAPDREHEKLM